MRRIISRLLRLDVLLIAIVLLLGGLIGLLEAREDPTYLTIGTDLEPLRSAFNADPDNVRAVLLASPT